ncbi:MAG: TetR/AcrR family transcriptional regulator [Opitutaceae bacterium]|nr:TetR/AcrR family transcriptional regulator [Opitutaceae bacterium]
MTTTAKKSGKAKTRSGTPAAADEAARARILEQVERELFLHGYSALTMDALAHELGMSKKTLYRHFPGKDEMVDAAIEKFAASLRAEVEARLREERPFVQTVADILAAAAPRIARLSEHVLRDLQRFAPELHRKFEDLRGKHFPAVWSALLRRGVAEGAVRADIDTDFAAHVMLSVLRSFTQPDVLAAWGLSPGQAIARLLDLVMNGLLTTKGRKSYEKHFGQ